MLRWQEKRANRRKIGEKFLKTLEVRAFPNFTPPANLAANLPPNLLAFRAISCTHPISEYTMKRSLDPGNNPKRPSHAKNEYGGYVVGEEGIEELHETSRFYEKFVEARRPVKIVDSSACPIDIDRFKSSRILETLKEARNGLLQVEKKHGLGFGLGKKRERMLLAEIVDRLEKGDESYYLTTQYEEHEYEELEEEDGETGEFGEDSGESDDELESSKPKDYSQDGESVEDEPDDEENGEGFEENRKNTKLASGGSGPAVPSESDDESEIDLENLHDDFDDLNSPEDEDYVVPEHRLTEEEVEARVSTLLQAPLTELHKKDDFPLVPELFKPLIPQQINLWMGAGSSKKKEAPDLKKPSIASLGRYVPSGNSSGLHHDHADNLYVLVQGKKRFTLFSPNDAEKLRTVGEIRKIFPNGLIDYKPNERARFWRSMREDGAMIGEWARWMIEKGDFSKYSKEELEEMIENDEPFAESGESNLDPPSFSTVPPLLAHLDEVTNKESREALEEFANRHFPGFLDLKKLEVWLNPGEMLYLPTGWFHEVTSFAEDGTESGPHVALNWWFVPPKGTQKMPYPDEYWVEDFNKTLAAIEYKKAV